ncbi:MAG TPA: type II toxin-antitoxin system HicB family antitoxin [Pyrinomonadaceae bacterium]|nr:type II toxin-antitoxin system HicB family antitoxin [Pyrinomonadaceae bacterium]
MELKLTAVFQKVPEGYIAFVEELPGANTQGATLEEARENLQEAVELVFEANRILAEEEMTDVDLIRETLMLKAA